MSYLLYDAERPVVRWGPRERARYLRRGYIRLEGHLLYGAEEAEEVPYLGLAGTSDYVDKYLKPFFKSADYQQVLGVCQMAEALLGPQAWKWKAQYGGLFFTSKEWKGEVKQAKAYLKKLAEQQKAAAGVSGLGQVGLAVGLAVKGISLVRSFASGRKAAQKARQKARGAKAANDYLQVISWRYCQLMEQFARLGYDPPDAPTSEEWRQNFERRLQTGLKGKVKADPSVMGDNLMLFFRLVVSKLAARAGYKGEDEPKTVAPAPAPAATPTDLAPAEQVKPAAAAPVAPAAPAGQKSAAPALIGLSLIGLLLRGGF